VVLIPGQLRISVKSKLRDRSSCCCFSYIDMHLVSLSLPVADFAKGQLEVVGSC